MQPRLSYYDLMDFWANELGFSSFDDMITRQPELGKVASKTSYAMMEMYNRGFEDAKARLNGSYGYDVKALKALDKIKM